MLIIFCIIQAIYLLLRDVDGLRKVYPGNLLTAWWSGQRTSVAVVAIQLIGNVLAQRLWIRHVHRLALPVDLGEQLREGLVASSGTVINLTILKCNLVRK